MAYKVISIDEASTLGLTRYFTGKSCPKGHISERLVSSRACIECSRLYDIVNKQKKYQYTKNWRLKNKDHLYEYDLKRRLEDPKYHSNKCARATKNRRARLKGAEGKWTEADIFKLLVDQKGLCVGCGDYIADCYEIDHRVPLVRGGSNWPYNLQLLCRSCNAQKNDKTMEEWYTDRVLVALSSTHLSARIPCRSALRLGIRADLLITAEKRNEAN